MTWTAPRIERTTADGDQLNVPSTADERAMLEGWLRWHRETLLTKCAGLTAAQLAHTTAEPSGLTLLGLVRHLAEIERWWFRRSFTGEPIGDVFTAPGDGDEGLEGADAAHAERDFAAYRAEVAACEAAVAWRGLDETFVSATRGRTVSLRWVFLVMIQEYARHNGHADLLRERTDGATGDYPPPA
ncbi:DinB family protein [Streptomyces sp. NBC_01005]|uniref:DinB family protein n=1 Tax=unclassified Streptomyces TaxID=2593676 RepID=UPI002E2F5ED5|nr:DinB family protein [Streptomyces sp. NBC_01362]WSW04265.1 DinB family protein [Streptomyces sp. NBC_01005]WTC93770.1 DinB family protein [Streptomyces sp. NBC_01650]